VSKRYPVLEILSLLKKSLETNPLVILQAPPGAGKSTVLPLQLMNETWLGDKKIVMLEPRRLAARSVALRMAEELGEEAGETIGYRVRFESKISKRTRIEVVTEGILTRMLQGNNSLDEVGLIIFDEFHERSMQADLALALCDQVQQLLRENLRILIMSATLEVEKISSLFNNAPVISSSGKQYPVQLHYVPFEKDVRLAQGVTRVIRKALREQSGDMLVFLPGVAEIHRVLTLLKEEAVSVLVVPLFGDLPFKKQQEAILPHHTGLRKVVLATSIAETSLTIEGITTVIDSGFSRVPRFDPRSGLTRLETVKVTRDAADQRAGRAGRLGPGVCYRLWSEQSHHLLLPSRQPEIMEADLAYLVLELSGWGIMDLKELSWITPPPEGAVNQAKELLHILEVWDDGKITKRGRAMLNLPTHPRIAHMLLSPVEGNNAEIALATDVAAILEEKDPLSFEAGADLSLRVEALRKWRNGESVSADRNVLERIERLARSWRSILNVQVDNTNPADTEVGRLIAEAYPERVARMQEKQSSRYKLVNGRTARIQEHDLLARETWLAIAQLDAGDGEGKIYLGAPVKEEDIEHRSVEAEVVKWDADKGIITANLEKRIGSVILSSKGLKNIPDELRVKVVCEAIRNEGFKAFGWDDQLFEWQARVMSLRAWRPDEDWPDVGAANLLLTLEDWLSPYLINVNKRADFNRLEWLRILLGLLPWQLSSKLDQLAPVRLQVPSGSTIRLTYFNDGRSPVMEVRLQELFGLLETPTVNEGRTKIVLHLLSPGYKPVQVTQDLRSFWQTTYHEVRKELRMRYPKHHWPEDPWTAEAVRGVKKRNNDRK